MTRTIERTKMNWLSAKDNKPPQGERVLLKVHLKGNRCVHIIGYWSLKWEICEQLMRVEECECCSEIIPEFSQDDVSNYAHFV